MPKYAIYSVAEEVPPVRDRIVSNCRNFFIYFFKQEVGVGSFLPYTSQPLLYQQLAIHSHLAPDSANSCVFWVWW